MLSARQFFGAATTALSLITGAFLLAVAAGNARAQGSAPACDAATGAWPGRTGVRARAFKLGFCTPKRSIGKLTKPSDRAGDLPFTR